MGNVCAKVLKKINLKLFISVLIFYSCNQNDKSDSQNNLITKIHVDPQKPITIKLDDFIEEIRIVPLQTTESSILGEIYGVKKVDNNFYINVPGRIYVFNDNGNFKKTIGKPGKGPRELLAVTNFYVYPEKNLIEIYDSRLGQNIWYNLEGYYIGSIAHGFNHGYDFMKSNEGGYFFYRGFSSEKTGELIYVSNLENEKHTDLLPFNKTLSKYLHFGDLVNFVSNRHGSYFTRSFNDTIYSLNGITTTPKYLVDFGEKTLPENLLYSDYTDVRDFMTTCLETSYAFRIIGFFELENYIVFGFHYKKKIWNALYNKNDKECFVISSYIDNYFKTNFEFQSGFDILPKGFNDQSLFILIDSYKIINFIQELKEKKDQEKLDILLNILSNYDLSAMKATDNPILLEVKLK